MEHTQTPKDDNPSIPEPGKAKKNPRDMDKLLDDAIKETLDASDPVSITQPDVHNEPGRGPSPKEDKP